MKQHSIEQIGILLSLIKWLILSALIGIIIGSAVTLFLKLLHYAEHSQGYLPFPHYYLLPFALMATVWTVRRFAPDARGHGTEKVIEAVHKRDGKIELAVIPVKLFATMLTVFSGGSVGKEGPSAQIGAGIASFFAGVLSFSKEDRKTLVICGIGAGFASVFGTPIAGAIFGVEVLVIGLIHYEVLLPSFISGFAAVTTAQLLGVEYTYFDIRFHQHVTLDLPLIFQVVLAGLFFGVVSDATTTSFRAIGRTFGKIPFNAYVKAFGGGTALVLLSLLVGDQYFGLGLETISDTLSPDPYFSKDVPWYGFLFKILYTGVTLGSGGSGGIVTPIFYIGATSGHWFGTIMGDHLALFAALGFVSVLAGTTNTPIAATIMAMELFGLEVAHYAALSVVISFLMTGHRSVFPSQILAMKKSDMLTVETGDDITETKVHLNQSEVERFRKIHKYIKNHRELRMQRKEDEADLR